MLRILASHIVPRQKEAAVKVGRLPLRTLDDLDRASEITMNKATSGKISLGDALDISSLVEGRRRVLVAQDLDRRLSALENSGALASETR
jgi:hypothetical protein